MLLRINRDYLEQSREFGAQAAVLLRRSRIAPVSKCHADNKFYHAHNLTPLPGALIYVQTAFCRSIKQTNYKS